MADSASWMTGFYTGIHPGLYQLILGAEMHMMHAYLTAVEFHAGRTAASAVHAATRDAHDACMPHYCMLACRMHCCICSVG